MTKPEISILMPGIRPSNWDAVYESILASTKRTFELIIVSPYPLTSKLQELKNVKYAKDFGSPVRCSNIAACLAEGELITWTADDAMFIPGALDKNIDLLREMGDSIENVVVAKYFEGQNGTTKPLQPNEYFTLNGSDWTSSPYIPKSWWLFNVAIMHREFFEDMGGWDASYEGTFYSHADMAARTQFMSSVVKMSDFPMLDCDHGQSDHPPVESAQVTHDKPMFLGKYRSPVWANPTTRIEMNNWKEAPSVWNRRFGI